MFKRRFREIVAWIFILVCIIFLVVTSHILTPLKLDKIEGKSLEKKWQETVVIEEASALNPTCYTGSLNDDVPEKEFYYGLLNYLCDTFGEKNISIGVKYNGIRKDRLTLAGASGLWGIKFFADAIQQYNPGKSEMAHIIFHEYIHLLMFRHMANFYTINYKSTQLIESVASGYSELDPGYLYPTAYAYDSPKEQIAEILGIYLSKSINTSGPDTTSYITITNFEEDLYNQFLKNIGK